VLQKALQDSFWKIRTSGLEMLVATEYMQMPEMQNQIQQMAETDKNSSVRATAMYAMSTLSGLPVEIIEKGLQDSSYQVVSASIFAYLRGNHDQERLQSFLTYKNAEVVNALAAGLSNSNRNDIYDWYLYQARKLRGGDLYYFVQSFGAYLLKKNIDEQERGWKALVTIVEKETLDVAKQSAFQMLTLMAETEERKQTLLNLVRNNPELEPLLQLQMN
jgi:aminopeptidase N